ncbi:MAG: dephospho-CoA kinase [Lentimicrobiaceae bacterium]|jgi:dephospho-CoA kinase|nr:dephospho-CoA kinase [Lentimicrobiaceae bacterium]
MALRVGITGNIGSGKTLVCSIFEHLNVPVFYADKEAKLLYDNDIVKRNVKNYFGSTSYFENGTLNRAFISECVFNDRKALDFLENILYPALNERFEYWSEQNQTKDYVLYEAALIFEKNLQSRFDKLILVTAPESLRLARVMKRDALSKEQIRLRMKQQWNESEKQKKVDFVIENDNQNMLIPQVLKIHQALKGASKNSKDKACDRDKSGVYLV